jgi:hypothetical protein
MSNQMGTFRVMNLLAIYIFIASYLWKYRSDLIFFKSDMSIGSRPKNTTRQTLLSMTFQPRKTPTPRSDNSKPCNYCRIVIESNVWRVVFLGLHLIDVSDLKNVKSDGYFQSYAFISNLYIHSFISLKVSIWFDFLTVTKMRQYIYDYFNAYSS